MITVTNREYKDHLGRVIAGGMPIANQGDRGAYSLNYAVFHGVVVTNNTVIEVVQGSPASLVLSGVENGWNGIGAVAGDTLELELTDQQGTTLTLSVPITIVDGNTLVIGLNIPFQFTASEGHAYINKTPQAVDCFINLVPSDSSGNTESIIDNTVVRISNSNISGLAVGANAPLTEAGNRSGAIINLAKIYRLANSSLYGGVVYNYRVEIDFTWWLFLSVFQQDYFFDIKTTTPFIRSSFYPIFNNFGTALTADFKPETDGNSGFRNENFNQNESPFSIESFIWKDTSGNVIESFDYSQDVEFEFDLMTSDTFGTNFGLIFFNDIQDVSEISADVSNDNGQYNHARHTIFAEKATLTATVGQSFSSSLGKDGEKIDFTDIEISISGSIATIKGKASPNTEFIEKFSNPENSEKTFTMLVRSETASVPASNYSKTVNTTAWEGEGEIAPVILGAFPFHDEEIYDHVNGSLVVGKDPVILIEDDNRLVLQNRFERGKIYKSITFKNIVQNLINGDFFELESYNFPFNTTILSDGTQDINISLDTYFAGLFPPSSLNSKFLIQKNGDDTLTEYGLRLAFPFLQRWESWIPQLGAEVIFQPGANKDWRNYQLPPEWYLAMAVEVEVEEGSYRNVYPYIIGDYNNNPFLDYVIEFERLDGTPLTAPLNDEDVKMRVIWTATAPVNASWCMITVEPTETSPRYVISSYYEQGAQPLNPLITLNASGDKLTISGNGTATIINECIFSPSRINGMNGVKFTVRIEGSTDKTRERGLKSYPLVSLPYIPEDQGKDGKCCDCIPELKLASFNKNDLILNDITGVVHKLQNPDTETCDFTIYKDGVLIPNFGVNYPSGFPNDPDVRAFVFNWRSYLIEYGIGCYEIKKTTNPAGIIFEQSLGKYELNEFTTRNAEGTTRILYQNNFVSQFDDYGVLSTINFADSGFEDSYRFRGMFGWWQPNIEVTNHYSENRTNRMANILSKEKFNLKMFNASQCMIDRLYWIEMHASIYRMSDHNKSNPQQKMIITDCVLDQEATANIDYFDGSRVMGSELILTKRQANSISRFDGSIELPKGVTTVLATIGANQEGGVCLPALVNVTNTETTVVASVTAPSGSNAIVVAPDGNTTLNSNPFISIPSGTTKNILLVDQTDTEIIPLLVAGNKIVVETGDYIDVEVVNSEGTIVATGTVTNLDNQIDLPDTHYIVRYYGTTMQEFDVATLSEVEINID